MITVQRDILVGLPLDDLVAYLEDFSRTEEWDPGTVRCVQVGEGPVRQGTEWRNTSRFRGRTSDLRYRLASREPARLLFVGENKTVTATDDLTFRARSATTTLLTYTASLRFKGVARLAAPFLRPEFERLADEVAATLPSAATTLRG
ncbi:MULTISPECIES: SRPBCC family protein [Streptomyces]|uniref:SRPBCC family protein n=1 Tax=Streptomyces TaxID=1883 RepID=UPI00017E82AA|nr:MULTISPECIES: SRPBCC family protein [Streptomyces]AKL69464.1 polyketide cyclase [Streptomyces sp. Mg1]EDX21562.1 carbon monoxide dehydrogenase subunit G [Streptomyces sp. Mg1]RPK32512.1 Polyketide cyclase / dehydrase and lipid transport [Streptomyces sp. ADI91-18]WBY23843.1 SRPBCC family protein [Streptomyces goshikiensis]